jgi:hypothetical protein
MQFRHPHFFRHLVRQALLDTASRVASPTSPACTAPRTLRTSRS